MAIGVYDVIVSLSNLYPIQLNESDLLHSSTMEYRNKYTKQTLMISEPEREPVYEVILIIAANNDTVKLLKEMFWLSFCCFYQQKATDIIVY
jgi:hypothetical protein